MKKRLHQAEDLLKMIIDVLYIVHINILHF